MADLVSHCIFALVAFSSYFLLATKAYDIRCLYPRQLGDTPFDTDKFAASLTIELRKETGQYETPHVIWTSTWSTMCRGLCLAYHQDDVLDPIFMTPLDPVFKVPEFGQNAFSQALCASQCTVHIHSGINSMSELFVQRYQEIGVDMTLPSARTDIFNAMEEYRNNGNTGDLEEILLSDDYHPFTMGHIAGFYIKPHMPSDGWNSDGSLIWDPHMEEAVPCTGNCRRFQNPIGYTPKPDPRKIPQIDEGKYQCTGICRKWQPLQESDDSGNLKHQEFITPHIGFTADTYLRSPTLTLQDPQYDLYEESLLVVERLANTTYDQYKKDAIRVFDDKLLVRGIVQTAMKETYSEFNSFQEYYIYLTGMGIVEYDGIIQAWQEKTYHDLVRPTTVIKHWGEDDLYTFGGNKELMHPVNIKARDFEAFIRVMPHAEFPSGSSCLCTTYYEYTDAYTTDVYNETLSDISWTNRETGNTYVLADLEALRDVCGESRLWGGMHYTAAIDAGSQVCSGLGVLALDYVTTLRNNATFNNPFYINDSLEACPE